MKGYSSNKENRYWPNVFRLAVLTMYLVKYWLSSTNTENEKLLTES